MEEGGSKQAAGRMKSEIRGQMSEHCGKKRIYILNNEN